MNESEPIPNSGMKIDDNQPGLGDMLYHAPDAIFIESLDGYVLDVNLQACKLHGLSREELVGRHVLELVPPEERETVEREFPKFVEGRMQMFEGMSLHQSGRRIPVELIVSRVQYLSQPALLIHVRDLSTRKALTQCDALNDAIMQALPGGVVRHDAQRRIVFANAQAIAFLCLEYDATEKCYRFDDRFEILHENGRQADFAQDWPGYRCMDQLQRQEETTLGLKCPCRIQSQWGVFSAMPVVDQQTRLCLGAVVSFVDTTELRSTLNALRESENRFHLAFDHAPTGMVLASPDGKFLQINNRFCTMLGYRWAELIKLSFYQIARPEDAELCRKFVDELIHSKSSRHSTRKRYIHKDGHDVWCQITVTIIRDDKGAPQYCINQIEDLTPQLKAQAEHELLEQRLRQAQKLQAIGTLASGVAHDFNNLLLAIESYLDMAQTQYQRGMDPTVALGNIRQAIRQSTGMTRSLLTFARQTNGNKQPVDLTQLVQQSMQTLKPLIPSNVNVVIENQMECPLLLQADISQIQQLLMNLVVNAKDAMPEGGTLTLRMESERCHGRRPLINLWVSDTGVGMDEQTRQRLFDPFFTTKSRGQGTGLGLAVVHGIVTDHQARIAVMSELGKSTHFKITFPAIYASESGINHLDEHHDQPRHIVLVQKDNMLQQVLDTMLRQQSVIVHGLPDAAALSKFVLDDPHFVCDLLVCDDQPDSQPDETLCQELTRRQAQFKWVVMTTQNSQPGNGYRICKALLLVQPMPVRELAKHLLGMLDSRDSE